MSQAQRIAQLLTRLAQLEGVAAQHKTSMKIDKLKVGQTYWLPDHKARPTTKYEPVVVKELNVEDQKVKVEFRGSVSWMTTRQVNKFLVKKPDR